MSSLKRRIAQVTLVATASTLPMIVSAGSANAVGADLGPLVEKVAKTTVPLVANTLNRLQGQQGPAPLSGAFGQSGGTASPGGL
ncbi:hypothetical protein ACFOSC_30485 [Streptantibioticus rubrisoli]|uniref:Secreted protein n=1 Tax=Streptantibioticus rubrisoli TaxID=1387313 RepID=A0ABT1PMD5_9ACTN|nr:hypothetical protein [Streptantibioticus rubrisoli]MCQ4046526.1 hypothetical protein [Streptantibioticus rubrisoli]